MVKILASVGCCFESYGKWIRHGIDGGSIETAFVELSIQRQYLYYTVF